MTTTDRVSAEDSTPDLHVLLLQAQDGDRAALEKLSAITFQFALIVCLGFQIPKRDAEDLAQETALRVFLKLGYFRSSEFENYYHWVKKIAQNVFVDWYRRQQRRPQEVPIDHCHIPDHVEAPSDEGDMSDQRLDECLDKLQPEFRAAIEHRFFLQLSYEDAAARLGVPSSTLKARVHRAKDVLAECMGGVRHKGSQGRHKASANTGDSQ